MFHHAPNNAAAWSGCWGRSNGSDCISHICMPCMHSSADDLTTLVHPDFNELLICLWLIIHLNNMWKSALKLWSLVVKTSKIVENCIFDVRSEMTYSYHRYASVGPIRLWTVRVVGIPKGSPLVPNNIAAWCGCSSRSGRANVVRCTWNLPQTQTLRAHHMTSFANFELIFSGSS